MADLFPALPIQRPPAQIVVGRHALVKCRDCFGTGLCLTTDEDDDRCPQCNGGGVRMRCLESENG